jgi:hypothetical protein
MLPGGSLGVIVAAVAPVARSENIQILPQLIVAGSPTPLVTCAAALPGPVTCPDVAGPSVDIVELGVDFNSPRQSSMV